MTNVWPRGETERLASVFRTAPVARSFRSGSISVTASMVKGRRVLVSRPITFGPTDTIFVDEDARVAIVGDHLIGKISSNPVVHRPLDRPADLRDRRRALVAYLDSLRATAELDLTLLLPGHGNPVEEGHGALVAERLDFHERRKERIFGALADGPLTAHAIALRLWADVAHREAFLTLSETLGHLDLLEDEGRVRQDEEDGLIRYSAV